MKPANREPLPSLFFSFSFGLLNLRKCVFGICLRLENTRRSFMEYTAEKSSFYSQILPVLLIGLPIRTLAHPMPSIPSHSRDIEVVEYSEGSRDWTVVESLSLGVPPF